MKTDAMTTILFFLGLFGFVNATYAGFISHTAYVDAITGPDVTGKCTSTADEVYTSSIDVDCTLKRGSALIDLARYSMPTGSSNAEVRNWLYGALQYQCVYCVRNESRFDDGFCPFCVEQYSDLACESSGRPPAPPGGGGRDPR